MLSVTVQYAGILVAEYLVIFNSGELMRSFVMALLVSSIFAPSAKAEFSLCTIGLCDLSEDIGDVVDTLSGAVNDFFEVADSFLGEFDEILGEVTNVLSQIDQYVDSDELDSALAALQGVEQDLGRVMNEVNASEHLWSGIQGEVDAVRDALRSGDTGAIKDAIAALQEKVEQVRSQGQQGGLPRGNNGANAQRPNRGGNQARPQQGSRGQGNRPQGTRGNSNGRGNTLGNRPRGGN